MKKIFLIFILLMLTTICVRSQNYESIITSDLDSLKKEMVLKMPEFPGGIEGISNYLRISIKYPMDAQKQKIEGRVLLEFIVSTTGEIKDVKVIEGLFPSCDAEAIRVMYAMPNWIPAEKDGEPIALIFKQPISFRLPK